MKEIRGSVWRKLFVLLLLTSIAGLLSGCPGGPGQQAIASIKKAALAERGLQNLVKLVINSVNADLQANTPLEKADRTIDRTIDLSTIEGLSGEVTVTGTLTAQTGEGENTFSADDLTLTVTQDVVITDDASGITCTFAQDTAIHCSVSGTGGFSAAIILKLGPAFVFEANTQVTATIEHLAANLTQEGEEPTDVTLDGSVMVDSTYEDSQLSDGLPGTRTVNALDIDLDAAWTQGATERAVGLAIAKDTTVSPKVDQITVTVDEATYGPYTLSTFAAAFLALVDDLIPDGISVPVELPSNGLAALLLGGSAETGLSELAGQAAALLDSQILQGLSLKSSTPVTIELPDNPLLWISMPAPYEGKFVILGQIVINATAAAGGTVSFQNIREIVKEDIVISVTDPRSGQPLGCVIPAGTEFPLTVTTELRPIITPQFGVALDVLLTLDAELQDLPVTLRTGEGTTSDALWNLDLALVLTDSDPDIFEPGPMTSSLAFDVTTRLAWDSNAVALHAQFDPAQDPAVDSIVPTFNDVNYGPYTFASFANAVSFQLGMFGSDEK